MIPYEEYSDEDLVHWCQQTLPDDTRAFEVLVGRYKTRVFAKAYRLLGDSQEAEDQAQEVFLKVYRGIKQLNHPEQLMSWIYQITTNTCLDALRKQRRRPATTPLDNGDTIQNGGATPAELDTESTQPDELVIQQEQRRCLEETLRRLQPVQRSILVLRDVDDCAYDEIANVLQLGLSAVKMRIHRARLRFQELLRSVCPELFDKYEKKEDTHGTTKG
jgi:RNA polymerase sigma-70 factor, ECF subfamily